MKKSRRRRTPAPFPSVRARAPGIVIASLVSSLVAIPISILVSMLVPALVPMLVPLSSPVAGLCGSAEAQPAPSGPAWIYWTEAAEAGALRAAARPALSPRALRRLARVGADTTTADPANRPAPPEFLAGLDSLGIRIRVVSRFLRAVSADLSAEEWRRLAADPRVTRIQPVARFRRERPRPVGISSGSTGGPGNPQAFADTLPDPRSLRPGDYGRSYGQDDQIDATLLHQLGYTGRGVLVCILDGGFFVGHEAFRRSRLEATRDFVGHDNTVGYDPNDPSEPYNNRDMETHGTLTWSTLGGFTPGRLLGPAYGASFLLGRTEITDVEIRLEEDTYVAGLEWADSLGADVVSSSLGYYSFDDGFSYRPTDLNGRTAVTSRAAAWIARRNVVLATAMGNENKPTNPPPNLITPADAESVVSVGAVDSSGIIAPFSSRGPTADGRTKPDVCAQGVATFAAYPGTDAHPNGYSFADGTSLSTPLVAGLAALLREAHPEWSAFDVQQALRRSGSRSLLPDNDYGWGVPDGLQAVNPPGGPTVSRVLWSEDESSSGSDSTASPGDSGSVGILLRNPATAPTGPLWISLREGSGRARVLSDSQRVDPIPARTSRSVTFRVRFAPDASMQRDVKFVLRIAADAGPVYYRRATVPLEPRLVQQFPYPNPARFGQEIAMDLVLPSSGLLRVSVYDAAGRLVAESYRDAPVGSRQRVTWTPGVGVPSGFYFLRVQGPGTILTRRLILLR